MNLTRRQLLLGGAMTAVGWAARERSALAQIAVAPGRREPAGDVLVTIFLRGGADALNVVVPHAEDAYHRSRPSLGLARPNDKSANATARTLDLDGFFGLNPALAPILPLYRDGLLAIVHAVGSDDQTHSHFEAMKTMERGIAREDGPASGWLARHLSSTPERGGSPLRAVALSDVMPDALRGATDALALRDASDFRRAPRPHAPQRGPVLRDALRDLYGVGDDLVYEAGRETLSVLETLNRVQPEQYRPERGAVYPKSGLGAALRQAACLFKANVGMEAAWIDTGGWDTHVAQGAIGGSLAALLDDLSRSLAAFAADLGPQGMGRVTVLVMSEFGRRLQENYSFGTDHGHGGFMFLLGGSVAGGRVHGAWPGLEPRQLDGPGDLRVTTDYRAVLAEVLSRRLKNAHIGEVFPGFTPPPLNVVRA